jgi:Na+-translocating ferredoxin:NAD+ oxidoreductase subunit C
MQQNKTPQIIWDFQGGIHPEPHKLISNQSAIRELPLFDEYIVPVSEKLDHEKSIQVEIGDHVYKGQLLAEAKTSFESNVHAPTSGKIKAIDKRLIPHPGSCKAMCITIETDYHDTAPESVDSQGYKQLSPDTLVTLIQEYGVNGLGGAGFPTATKFNPAATIDTLVVNGVECEPYITCDDRLMRENANEIIEGILLALHISSAEKAIIAIEDDKPQAIDAMKLAAQSHALIEVLVLPTKYPSGSEKQLFVIATGIEIPNGKRPHDVGLMMLNVGTCYALKQAVVNNLPLIERITTLTGKAMPLPGNYRIRIGTKLSDLIKHFNIKNAAQILFGGPMMGFPVENQTMSLSKTVNCVIFAAKAELASERHEMPCIRCGDCQDVCPAGLLPQQLLFYSKNQQHEKALQHQIFDCIECGACSYVCPSDIPLVDYYRHEKSVLKQVAEDKRLADIAKQRFENRNLRLERIQKERADKRAQIQKQRELAQQNKTSEAKSNTSPNGSIALSETADDPKKAAIAAALARVQAKKSNKAQENSKPDTSKPDNTNADVEDK